MEIFVTTRLRDKEFVLRQCESGMYYFDTVAAAYFDGANLTSTFDSTADKPAYSTLLWKTVIGLHPAN